MLLASHLGVPVKRQLGQARDGGADILLPPFLVEVKRRRKIAALRWLEQVRQAASAKPGHAGLVILREDGAKEWAVLCSLPLFLDLAGEAMRSRFLHRR